MWGLKLNNWSALAGDGGGGRGGSVGVPGRAVREQRRMQEQRRCTGSTGWARGGGDGGGGTESSAGAKGRLRKEVQMRGNGEGAKGTCWAPAPGVGGLWSSPTIPWKGSS